MGLRRAATYAAVAIGLLVLLGVAVSIVTAVVGLVWATLRIAATLLILAALGYGVVRIVRWLRGDDAEQSAPADEGATDPVERLTERYVNGDLSEDELEDRLDRVLGGPDGDEIDRELERTTDGG